LRQALFVDTVNNMKKKRGRGRPPKDASEKKGQSLLVRLDDSKKEAFKDAADLAGVPLSTWVRERLRQIAGRELGKAARPVAFLRQS
jgi:predicted HicB family RNase H-like nuclease